MKSFFDQFIRRVNIEYDLYNGNPLIEMDLAIPMQRKVQGVDDVSNFLLDTLLQDKCGMTLEELKNKIPENFI